MADGGAGAEGDGGAVGEGAVVVEEGVAFGGVGLCEEEGGVGDEVDAVVGEIEDVAEVVEGSGFADGDGAGVFGEV